LTAQDAIKIVAILNFYLELNRMSAPSLRAIFLIALSIFLISGLALADSQCYGTVSKGRIERSVRLPTSGPNFSAYSTIAATAGRTYVHSKVAAVLAASYGQLQASSPDVVFVYGETGWAAGGRFRPHRTHQNGLSVDFFVPVRNAKGQSVALPISVSNRWGYDIEFGADSRFGDYLIDYEALAEHLYQLHQVARAQGIGIARVIFDIAYLPKLFATPRGPYLQANLPFMKSKPWVRHDEHYHVDFAVPCKPEM
jgi:penicillin-insensitive murein DD-endopeptidase